MTHHKLYIIRMLGQVWDRGDSGCLLWVRSGASIGKLPLSPRYRTRSTVPRSEHFARRSCTVGLNPCERRSRSKDARFVSALARAQSRSESHSLTRRWRIESLQSGACKLIQFGHHSSDPTTQQRMLSVYSKLRSCSGIR